MEGRWCRFIDFFVFPATRQAIHLVLSSKVCPLSGTETKLDVVLSRIGGGMPFWRARHPSLTSMTSHALSVRCEVTLARGSALFKMASPAWRPLAYTMHARPCWRGWGHIGPGSTGISSIWGCVSGHPICQPLLCFHKLLRSKHCLSLPSVLDDTVACYQGLLTFGHYNPVQI